MKSQLLFPSYLKFPGFLVFLLGVFLFVAWSKFDYQIAWLSFKSDSQDLGSILDRTDNYTFSLALSLILLGLIFAGFSRLKFEDEMIAMMRLNALQLSMYITVFVFLLITLFTFGLSFLSYAMWLWYGFLLLYCIIFYAKILISKSATKYEE